MSDESCVAIEIVKEFPFFSKGEDLVKRLRNVRLRGFPDVRIYENASFEIVSMTPEETRSKLHIPQPSVYRTHLEKIDSLYKLFKEKGIDILHLDRAYDFNAKSKLGQITGWTMIPPIVERFHLPRTTNGKVDYTSLIGNDLNEVLTKEGLGINPQVHDMVHPSENGFVQEINDGSHRVHYGVENGIGVNVLIAEGMTPGFPYYAVPQLYSEVRMHDKRDVNAIETKIHVLDSPGHKHLYRLFPSGGIMSGSVRYDPKLVK